jgi:hypothetical protein
VQDGVHGAELGDLTRWEGTWAATIRRNSERFVVDEFIVLTFEGGDVKTLTIESNKSVFEKVFLEVVSVICRVIQMQQ